MHHLLHTGKDAVGCKMMLLLGPSLIRALIYTCAIGSKVVATNVHTSGSRASYK